MKCPQCGYPLRKFELIRGGYILQCLLCGFQVKTPTDIEEEELEEWLESWIKKQKEIERDRSLSKIGKNAPGVVRDVLGTARLIYYRVEDPEMPEMGDELEKVAEEVGIPDGVVRELQSHGIKRMYAYQARAIREIAKGKDVMIVAPTGSGKTEAFFLGILPRLSRGESGIKALLVYPTKALGRDQLQKLYTYSKAAGLKIGVFEGDTPEEERKAIIENPPDILVTNMDILHFHMGFRHPLSGKLRNVKILVVDEVHVYTGTFGSHVHYVWKRLEMLSRNKIQLIAASATVANPKEFGKELFSRDFSLIRCDKGVHGKRYILIMEPLYSSWFDAVLEILSRLRKEKVLVFVNSQQLAEKLAHAAKKRSLSVGVHRAGLLPSYRKKVEREFREGELSAVISTPTLELGLDIGDVSVVISEPIDIMSFYQRIGRAGRKGQTAVAILMLRPDSPISQYYSRHPEDFFTDLPPLYLEPQNPLVIGAQVAAMANGFHFTEGEIERFLVAIALHQGTIKPYGNLYVATKKGLELIKRGIRSIGEIVRIKTTDGKLLGHRVLPIALKELHPKARYYHAGQKYIVKELDMSKKIAYVSPTDDSIITNPLSVMSPKLKKKIRDRTVYGLDVFYGSIEIEETIVGVVYKGGPKRMELLESPVSYKYETLGFVFTVPPVSMEPAGSYHAVEHVLIESSDILTGFSSKDIGGISMGDSGTIFVHDGTPGGNGASYVLYSRLEEAFRRAYEIVSTCKCTKGCPRCIQSYRCGNNNRPLSKKGAQEVLKKVLSGERTEVDLSPEKGIR